jgi:NAD(P)-dependent dehydrogenase (short-subunit alcohol dehydrogenase family)
MATGAQRFAGKHVIITGAGTGIGRSTANRFADEGARVVIANRNRANGERVAAEIQEKGGTACYISCDVASPESIDELIKQAVATYGPIHVAVSNAGINEKQPSVLDLTVEEWDRIINVNARGSLLFCRACGMNMMDNGIAGSIVTVSSAMARGLKTETGAYPASKAAVVMFTKNLAKCFAPMGIRVNCVSPGVVATEIWHSIEDAMMAERDTFIDWIIEESVKNGQLLIPRKGEPGEVASAIAFLASDEASYITAQNLSVDGGMDWCW